MRLAAAGDASRKGVSSSSSSSSSSNWGSSSTSSSTAGPTNARLGRFQQNVSRASSLQHQLPKDPPSAYHILRQQLAQEHGQQQQHTTPQQQQQQQQGASQRQARWPRAADEDCKAISRRLKQAGSTAAVLQVVQHHAPQFNAVNTALAYAQLARQLRFDTSSGRTAALQHSCYSTLQATALQQVGGFNPRQVVMMLTSLAWMHCPAQEGHSPAAPAAPAVSGHIEVDLQQPEGGSDSTDRPHTSSDTEQQQQQHELLLQLLSNRLQLLLDDFEPEDTCHCLWALTKLGALQSHLLAAATAHSINRGWLHSLTAKPLSSLLWVHAQLHLQQRQQQQPVLMPQRSVQQQHGTQQQPLPAAYVSTGQLQDEQQQQQEQENDALLRQLVCAVMQELSQPGFLATWTPQELSMLLWSCAVLEVPLEQQQQEEEDSSHSLQQQQQQQQVQRQLQQGQRAGAVSQERQQLGPVAVLPVGVLQQVCRLAHQHVVQFTPQGVAMVCWSISQLITAAATATTQALTLQQGHSMHLQQQQQQQQHASQRHLALLPAELQQEVLQLLHTFTAAAASRLQYYRPQEVCNMWSACSRLPCVSSGPFRQAAEAYISTHTHLLAARDVTELLLAAPQQQQQQGEDLPLDAVAVRALLHRVGQLLPDLSGFQLAAAAWACVRLSEQQGLPTRSYNSSRRAMGGGSSLQAECMATAAVLLGALDHRLVQAAGLGAGAVDAAAQEAAAAGGFQVLQDMASAASSRQGDVKQAVALAWALAVASNSSGLLGSTAVQQQQQQHASLLAVVLEQLQQGVAGCDGPALVQVLCVLVRLQAALTGDVLNSRSVQHTGAQQPQFPALQLQQVHSAAVARLLTMLSQLSAEQAATAVWAAVKLQVQLGGSIMHSQQHPPPPPPQEQQQGQQQSGHHGAAGVVSAVLQQLYGQQQLPLLPGHAVSALLWCCKACRQTPPAAVLSELLKAADAKLLQMHPGEQAVVLQALAVTGPHKMLQQQQQQRQQQWADGVRAQQLLQQHARLVHGIAEQLQHQLQQQSLQLSWQLRHPAAQPAPGTCSATHTAAARQPQQSVLEPQEVLSVVAACSCSPQLQLSQLLVQCMEVWQQQLQLGMVTVHQALRMLLYLADILPDSPSRPWFKSILQQQQQHQLSELTGLLPQLLHQAVVMFSTGLVGAAANQQEHHQQANALQPDTLVLALRVFAKMRYEPPVQVLSPLLQQLQVGLPVLPVADITAAVVATTQLGIPAAQFIAAAVSEMQHRQSCRQSGAASLDTVQQQQQQQQMLPGATPDACSCSRAAAVGFIWAVLSCGLNAPDAAGATAPKRAVGLLLRLAQAAAKLPTSMLLCNPQLLLQLQQVRHMLRYCRRYRPLHQALTHFHTSLPQDLLLQQLRSMSHLLLPRDLVGRNRQQALLQLLHANQHQHTLWLQQRLQARHQEQLQEQVAFMAGLMPLWLQYQLQKQCQQQLAREVVAAQAAAGRPASRVQLRYTATGDVVLLLRSQQQHAAARSDSQLHRLQVVSEHSDGDPATAGKGGWKGVAVVLEVPSNVSVNTGRPLGSALVRTAVLQAEGFHVLTLPVQPWLPDYILRHQHQVQLQRYEQDAFKQQYMRHKAFKSMRKLGAARRQQVQQLLKLLQST